MNATQMQNPRAPRRRFLAGPLLWMLAAMIAVTTRGNTQQLTGTISGTAYDQTGAVVAHARVVLKNEASGDQRTSTTDSAGHFAITGVQPATYSLEVSEKGFSSWRENNVAMGLGAC